MNEQDKEYLEAVYAGLAMVGLIIRGDDLDITKAWMIAGEMMKGLEKEPEEGIVAIKKRTRRKL